MKSIVKGMTSGLGRASRAATTIFGTVLLMGGLVILSSRAADAGTPAPSPSSTDAAGAKAKALLELFQSESDVTNSLGMRLVHVPEGYRVGQYEITQSDYQKVMGSNPSRFTGPRRPVERVAWSEAIAFCQRLTQQESGDGVIPPGYSYALPTEKQWEYFVDEAALQDSITSHLGDRRSTENVGGLRPNKFGLYDVRGNVWEWCSSPIARGASFRSHEDYLAVAFKFAGSPESKYDDIGFRVVLQPTGGPR